MKKHTPGPWEVRYGCVRESDEGFGIASRINPEFGIVAECWPCTTTPESRAELAANAHLIATSPRLLAACESVLRECRPVFVDVEDMSDEWKAIDRELLEVVAAAHGGILPEEFRDRA